LSSKAQSTRYKFLNDPNALFTETSDLPSAIAASRNVINPKPVNPAGTTSTTPVMMGLAISFTPLYSGRVKIIIAGEASNNTLNDGFTVNAAYGTGAAPANGAAAIGTVVGNTVTSTALAASELKPFTIIAVVTGLTVGTAIWVDLQLAAVTGGTASVSNLSVIVEEF
jgi:hypothetical protein